MPRVMLIDDDPITARVYQVALSKQGYEVETAENGINALQSMRLKRPDVVVLDLMMPRLSGADVLKAMRQQPGLEKVPVIVLSNAYMAGVANEAVKMGAQMGFLKVRCTPAILMVGISELLEGTESSRDASELIAVAKQQQRTAATPTSPAKSPAPAPGGVTQQQRLSATTAKGGSSQAGHDTALHKQVRTQFLENAETTCSALRSAFERFKALPVGESRNLALRDFYRQVHFLAASAGLAECARLAEMGSALEALVFQLMDDPARVSSSALHTATSAIGYIEVLIAEAREGKLAGNVGGNVLVVDDDPVSNRLVIWALTQAGLQARSVQEPAQGLKLLGEKTFDLVLLDVEMPGMDGFEFCRQARQVPGYAGTPVIYVTAHSSFETQAKSILAGGTDVIGKPILPMDLAVKAVMHLLKGNGTH